jgi:hypothetical protein
MNVGRKISMYNTKRYTTKDPMSMALFVKFWLAAFSANRL